MTRIAVGSMMQETNTFVPMHTTLETFASYYILHGEEMLDGYQGARIEVPAFLEVLQQAGVTVLPLLAAYAAAGGPLTQVTFDTLLNELLERLQKSLPVDAVLLALHGAMVVEDDPDAEGTILRRVRALVGPQVPIGVSLDLHGHITPLMVEHATFMVGYREYPHIDIEITGTRTAQLLLETLEGRAHPVMALTKVPMIVSPVIARTTAQPLQGIVEAAREMERAGRALQVSLFPVQPWLDVPDLGFAILVVADGDRAAAQNAADELAALIWAARERFEPDLVSIDEAIRSALGAAGGLTVVGDVGDAPTGGSAADNAGVLRALCALGADRAAGLTYLTLCDAQAAQAAAAAGIDCEVTLQVGHKLSTADGLPFTITGRVQHLSDGRYHLKGSGATGLRVAMGLTAVLAIGSIRLVLRSLPAIEWDPEMYRTVGLDLSDAALVFVKSPSHFRHSFAPLASRVLAADTPGPTCGNMRKLQFTRVTRPLYPLDE